MKLVLVMLAVVGVALAGPLQKKHFATSWLELYNREVNLRNSALEQIILNFLEDLRVLMLTGTDDIPVLDPLQIQQIGLDGAVIDFPGSHVNLNGLTVRHLSTFDVENLSLEMTSLLLQRYTLTFSGHIPSIDISANEYDLNLSALGFSVFGKGEASLRLVKPRLSGTIIVTLRLLGGISVSINTVDLRLELEGFDSNIRGLFGDESASTFANMFLSHLVPDLVKFYEADISSFLNETVLSVANDILGNIDISGILG